LPEGLRSSGSHQSSGFLQKAGSSSSKWRLQAGLRAGINRWRLPAEHDARELQQIGKSPQTPGIICCGMQYVFNKAEGKAGCKVWLICDNE
jgi:hypothetical protein